MFPKEKQFLMYEEEIIMANSLAAPGPNSKYKKEDTEPAGFWDGLWHGIIAPITFIVSLFNPDVRIYETNNKGISYDFGFLIGISGSVGSSSRTF